ncbi:lytic transglycosylase domain-containing protein [Shewanella yunxiaonensis]|uniref:Lytic transglycosylase domain-containing protein n=1 Tax=Shewanella yunxiaonensis TaxID=2829809 RepID=A0ABX7YUI9_9GAMM|nr:MULTISPECIES: lytic transglycosylase domain-containing protein [Shewanella]MDF0534636.1 lytic transglycosylase domain-containing protein [Shewanella sp. A32]QUN05989.1 lytic transglycosylase domain-containing protein [Shewanella yunxiaonensis]
MKHLLIFVATLLVITLVHAETNPPKRKIIAHYSAQGTSQQLQQEKVYRSSHDGITVFSDRIPSNDNYEVLLFDCYACNPSSTINWRTTPLFRSSYKTEIAKAAKAYQLDPALIRAVIHAESAFNSAAESRTGAIGLMQLMPKTAKALGVANAFSAPENIDAGSRYLAQMLQRFNGNISLACAAYNAGPTTVSNYNGIPPYPETKAYVERVGILLQRYRAL